MTVWALKETKRGESGIGKGVKKRKSILLFLL